MQVSVDTVDFKSVACGFEYETRFTLQNTGATSLPYAWQLPTGLNFLGLQACPGPAPKL